MRACERCKPALLHRIFDERYLYIFKDWAAEIFFGPSPLGYEWQWEDLLKEKGCRQVVGIKEASLQRASGEFLVARPNGDSLSP